MKKRNEQQVTPAGQPEPSTTPAKVPQMKKVGNFLIDLDRYLG